MCIIVSVRGGQDILDSIKASIFPALSSLRVCCSLVVTNVLMFMDLE